MMTEMWLYNVTVYIYALSLLFYFSDYLHTSQSAKRLATGFLSVVWLLQSCFFLNRVYTEGYLPIVSLFETLFFFSWLLVTFSLVMHVLFRLELFLFYVQMIGFIILVINLFTDSSVVTGRLASDSADQLLQWHIISAMTSYSIFSLSAVFSGMYVYLHHKLKEKEWSFIVMKSPSLEKIETYAYRSVLVALPFLVTAVALGVMEMVQRGMTGQFYDPKILFSLFVLASYTVYIIQRILMKCSGYVLAKWNLGAFSVVLINFIILNIYSQFHPWLGGHS